MVKLRQRPLSTRVICADVIRLCFHQDKLKGSFDRQLTHTRTPKRTEIGLATDHPVVDCDSKTNPALRFQPGPAGTGDSGHGDSHVCARSTDSAQRHFPGHFFRYGSEFGNRRLLDSEHFDLGFI